MNGTFAFGFLVVIVVAILVILFLVSQWRGSKRCPKCGELMNIRLSSRRGDRWICEACGHEEGL